MHTHKVNPRPALRWMLAAAGFYPALASALGLGDIQVKSALSQPFEAEIAVLQDRPGEAELASVALASATSFERAGMDRRFFLSGLRFSLETRRDGSPYVRVHSDAPVREPYLDFLVEVVWPAGTLLRQYTVLLDPPTRPWVTLVTPEVTAAAPASTGRAPRRTPGDPAMASARIARSDPFGNVVPPAAGTTYGPVRPGDTLWAIAARARPAGVSMSQAMHAIMRANPEAFIGGRADRMMAGSRLVIPDAAALAGTGFAVSNRAMSAQIPGWAQRAEPEAPVAPKAPEAATQAPRAEGELERTGAEQAAAPDAAGGGELKLLQAEPTPEAVAQGEAAGNGAAGSESRLQLLEESLDSSRQENAALRGRLEQLETQFADLSHMLTPQGEGGSVKAAMVPGTPGGVAGTPPGPPTADAGSMPTAGKFAVAAVALLGGVGYLVARRLRRSAPQPLTVPEQTPHQTIATAPVLRPAPAVIVHESPRGGPLPGTDAVASDLDLLAALVAGGDAPGARALHSTIVARGDASQRAQAHALLAHLRA